MSLPFIDDALYEQPLVFETKQYMQEAKLQNIHFHLHSIQYSPCLPHVIHSHLDYANSLLLCAPIYVINKLQHIQNSVAIIVLESYCLSHSASPVAPLLATCPQQNLFKLATITYKALSATPLIGFSFSLLMLFDYCR